MLLLHFNFGTTRSDRDFAPLGVRMDGAVGEGGLERGPRPQVKWKSRSFYSRRRAIIGSTRTARRVGTYVAATATPQRRRIRPTRTTGSKATTPKRLLAMTRVRPTASGSPTAMPMTAVRRL